MQGEDYVLAKRIDLDEDGKLNEQEKKNAYDQMVKVMKTISYGTQKIKALKGHLESTKSKQTSLFKP